MKFYTSAIVLALFLSTSQAIKVENVADCACPGDNDVRLKAVLEALSGPPPAPTCGCNKDSGDDEPKKKSKSGAKSVKKAIENMRMW